MKKTKITAGISIVLILAVGAVALNPDSAFARKLPAPVKDFIKKVVEFSQSGFSNIWTATNRWFQRVTGYTLNQVLKAVLNALKNFIVWVYKLVLKILEWAISLLP